MGIRTSAGKRRTASGGIHMSDPIENFVTFTTHECESRVAYGVLVNPHARRECSGVLGPRGGRYFENPVFAYLYDFAQSQQPPAPIDYECCMEHLDVDFKDVYRAAVIDLYATNYTSVTAVYWARVVLNRGQRRLSRDLGNMLAGDEPPTTEAIEAAMRDLRPPTADHPRSLTDILPEAIDALTNPALTRVSSGYHQLDALIGGGFGNGWLTVIGARTGRGKTAMSVNLAINAARRGERVLFYALEMSDIEIFERAVRAYTGVMPKGSAFTSAGENTSALPIKIAPARSCTVQDVESAIEAERANGTPPGLVIVDYLQLMAARGKATTRQEQVSDVSRDLKRLARTTGIPIITPSQLRRQNDQEVDGRPALHHLRESGSIEQDADLVILLSSDGQRYNDSVNVVADVAKNRHGPTGEIMFSFHLPSQRFIDPNSNGYGDDEAAF